MKNSVNPQRPHRLLVEGKDDLHSVIHLLRRHGIDYDAPSDEMPYIHSTDGYIPLLETIAVAAKTYKRLGILIDADFDVNERWTQISSKLAAIEIAPPASPGASGTIISGILPGYKIGIWLMPNNVDPGMLETFLGFLIPGDDQCIAYAETAVREAKKLGAPFSSTQLDKAKIHTWLAWQEDPGQPFGTAITASCFRTDTPLARNFVEWYKSTFFL